MYTCVSGLGFGDWSCSADGRDGEWVHLASEAAHVRAVVGISALGNAVCSLPLCSARLLFVRVWVRLLRGDGPIGVVGYACH